MTTNSISIQRVSLGPWPEDEVMGQEWVSTYVSLHEAREALSRLLAACPGAVYSLTGLIVNQTFTIYFDGQWYADAIHQWEHAHSPDNLAKEAEYRQRLSEHLLSNGITPDGTGHAS
jgi:hypothetical protein